jgi:hypothetical protein
MKSLLMMYAITQAIGYGLFIIFLMLSVLDQSLVTAVLTCASALLAAGSSLSLVIISTKESIQD